MGKVGMYARRSLAVGVMLLGILAVAGVIWFLADGRVEADVVHKECHALGGSALTVQTRWFEIERTVDVAYTQCEAIPSRAYVEYYVRSGRTVVFDAEGGECIWDTGGLGPC